MTGDACGCKVGRVADRLDRLAAAIGLTTIVYEQDESPELPPMVGEGVPPTLRNRAHSEGIAEVTVELNNGKWISDPETTIGTRAVTNLLKAEEMLAGEPDPQDCRIVPSRHTGGDGINRFHGMVYADGGGVLYPTREPGEFIQAGEAIAEITDLHGNVVETVEMPVDGYV
jgi:predicted deacylase